MGILHMNTADVGDDSLWQSSTLTVSSTQARTGTYSFAQGAAGRGVASFQSTDEGYMRSAYFVTDGATHSLQGHFGIALKEGSRYHLILFVDATNGALELYRQSSSNLLASESGGAAKATWGAIEIYWLIANAGGRCTVKVNGTTLIDFTGDTQNAGVGVVNAIEIGAIDGGGWGSASTLPVYHDDIMVRDDQWPYRGGIHVLVPDAAGDYEHWSTAGPPGTATSTGTGYGYVDELPTSYEDYLWTDGTVGGTEHLCHITTLEDNVWNIRGVGVHVNNRSDESSDAFVRTLLLPADGGASVEVGSDWGVETYQSWARTFYAVNPHDAAVWEKADIDDVQIGVESRVPA